MNEVTVEIKNIDGVEEMFPACPESQMFCDVAGTKTLTQTLQNILIKRGWQIKLINPKK